MNSLEKVSLKITDSFALQQQPEVVHVIDSKHGKRNIAHPSIKTPGMKIPKNS